MAGSKTHPVITVRALNSIPDYQGAVHLQQEIWGFSELDSLPTRLFVVASKIGGHTICALGDAAAMPVQSFLKHFGDEFAFHVEHKRCMV